ncbi:MAG: cell division protein ZapE, partial [Oceanococcus sp.]
PLDIIAEDLAREVRVLCFDEFFVSDVADAMILGRLMSKLFGHGITLVATSNIPPDDLYRDGLQRDAFVPAIEALKQACHTVEVNGDTDFRLRLLEQAHVYHLTGDDKTERVFQDAFRQIAPDAAHAESAIDVNGRGIPVRKHADGIAWFEFDALCRGPRAADDYIEIAKLYSTVMLTNVPQMNWEQENEARRFLHMVDEFYDRRVKLMIAAQTPMEDLYVGKRLEFEYARVLSRLQEMQSHDYLAQPHRP